MNKLCVSNISYSADNDDLEDIFLDFGEVIEASIAIDSSTLKSRGFGFVTFKNAEDARLAVEKMQNYSFKGRVLNVKFAENPNERPRNRGPVPFRNPEFAFGTAAFSDSKRIRVWVPEESEKRSKPTAPSRPPMKRRPRRERVMGAR